MLKIRCIAMQKNETHLLDTWVKYYSYLFGIENLYILDNGSNKEGTKSRLNFYQKLGCNIIYGYDTKMDFESKGYIISNIVKEWDEKEQYDFVVLLDIDEYLILDIEQPTCNREKILQYFASLVNSKEALIIPKCYINVPNEVGFFYPMYVPKSCFASGTMGYLDHGFHMPMSKYSKSNKNTSLGYLHFHNRSFPDLLKQAKEKLIHHVNIDDKKALKAHKGHGEHLIKYFFMTEEEYVNTYSNKGNIYFYELLNLFLLLSIDINAIFNATYIDFELSVSKGILIRYPSRDNDNFLFGYFNKCHYFVRNRDISQTSIDPIFHFCDQGFKEFRPLNLRNKECAVPKKNFKDYISNPVNLENFNKKLKELNIY